MKILTDTQIKQADIATIENEPIESVDLMERASVAIAAWITANVDKGNPLLFVVGKGNNGGDGLAVARMLYYSGYKCSIYLPFETDDLTNETLTNLKRLPPGVYQIINLEGLDNNCVIIDALLGSGVKGEVKEPVAQIIHELNLLPNTIIAIDLPSGMQTEFDNAQQCIVKADITLALEFPKLAMLLPEAGEFCGKVVVLPIGLNCEGFETPYYYTTLEFIKSNMLRRAKFAYKNIYGHALLICGSQGMMGAAALATGAALRSGCGLLTLHLPFDERFSIQSLYPSAMLSFDAEHCFSELPPDVSKYSSIGVGSGLGQSEKTIKALGELLQNACKPMVIDADALTILAKHNGLQYIPANSILTPHIGELKRLVGEWSSEAHKIELVQQLAFRFKVIVIVKGAHTMICLPNGNCYFNSTGNSGMAKGGSGDVLLGFITGLLARGYTSAHAAVTGVCLHGLAGDMAAKQYGVEAMNSNDLINFLPEAFKQLY